MNEGDPPIRVVLLVEPTRGLICGGPTCIIGWSGLVGHTACFFYLFGNGKGQRE